MTRTRRSRLLSFEPSGIHTHEALVLIFDLEGFSSFCAQPGAEPYVPRLLNRVFGCLELVLDGSALPWVPAAKSRPAAALPLPQHQKFLGDGGLYIWLMGKRTSFGDAQLVSLMNRLWTLKRHFPDIVATMSEEIPLPHLPRALRVGLARGPVQTLVRSDTDGVEYAGYCVNLASRLQSYCRDLGFIASARLDLPVSTLRSHKFRRVVATHLRGFPREVVLVDDPEYRRLPADVRRSLFERLR